MTPNETPKPTPPAGLTIETVDERARREAAERAAWKAAEAPPPAPITPEAAAADKAHREHMAGITRADAGPGPLTFTGRPGAAFSISGHGFGSSGVLTIGGRTVTPTSWTDTHIAGTVPADLPIGPTPVVVNGHTINATL